MKCSKISCFFTTMSVLRQTAIRSFAISPQRLSCGRVIPVRLYAKSKGKGRDIDPSPDASTTLIPRSQRILDSPAALAEYNLAKDKMQTSVDWYRKECGNLEMRASGRVTPALISPLKVPLPGHGHGVRLEEIATVGVRDGSVLWIVAFEEQVRTVFCAHLLSLQRHLTLPLSRTSNISSPHSMTPSYPA
jgi:hypothetical protein